jgi:hypothetical protein
MTLELLRISQDRADWGVYPCEICGQNVGVSAANGNWLPERHWPSVTYTPRKPSVGRYLAKTMIPAKLRMRPN